MMKKYIYIFIAICITLSVFGFDYVPKNIETNPFEKTNSQLPNINSQKTNKLKEFTEIKNLNEYFQYLPHAVNNNWIPYKAEAGYEVCVQFRVHNDGSITDIEIVNSTNEKANTSVLNAVKQGAPYKPLPKSYPSDTVRAQVILEYRK